MTRPFLYVMQDGREFYTYRDRECESPGQVWSAPFAVRDSDLPAAERARERFMAQAKFAGWDVQFIEECAQ